MLNTLPVRLLWRSFNWLTRLFIAAVAGVAMLMALAIIALRYWILPDIEKYHEQITASMAYALANPLFIGKIEADWQGLQPRLIFTDVRILDEQRVPALVLQRVDGSLSWTSLFTAQLRLASLDIDRPELLVRRDQHGNLFIGNLPFSRSGSNNDLADWMLRQANMSVRNGLLVWFDEQRNTPPLVLEQVDLRVANLFGRHSFALRAVPPRALATPLDVRGEFYGESFDHLENWRGELFTQLDYTDVTAWRPWLDMPSEFSRGRGALRGWLGVHEGKITQLIADVDMRGVATRPADDVPELVVDRMRGRVAWQKLAGGFEFSTKHLAMKLQNGIEFQPTDFYFNNIATDFVPPAGSAAQVQSGVIQPPPSDHGWLAAGPAVSGEIRANQLQLEYLAGLAKFFPVEAGLRASLEAYDPHGKISNLEGQWRTVHGKLDGYKIKAHVDNLALKQVGKVPGFSGLTLDVDGNEATGRMQINSRHLTMEAPGIMREPVHFATLTGRAGWQQKQGTWSINADNITVANDDLAGNVHGSYIMSPGSPGMLDLTVGLMRADIRRAARYTPLVALDKESNDWLNGALLAGHTEDFLLHLKSGLGAQTQGSNDSLLEISAHAKDAVMLFDKNWPRIENISCEFSIRGNRLEVKSPSATMLGAALQNVNVVIPDVASKDMALEIKGEAVAANNTFLDFIQKSPVRGYIEGFTDGVIASGYGHLDLFTRIPLLGSKPVRVNGSLSVRDSDIDLGERVPLLRSTRGALTFTETGMQAKGVSAEILGGVASINVQTAEGGLVHATLHGRSNVDALRRASTLPLLNYLHGSANWDADIKVLKNNAQLVIDSNLQGINSRLPQPFAKLADQALPIHIEKNPVLLTFKPGRFHDTSCPEPCLKAGNVFAEGQDAISIQLGNLLKARLVRHQENGAMAIKRGSVALGSQNKVFEPRAGVWLSGTLPVLSIEGWGGLVGNQGNNALPLAGANVSIEKLTGYGLNVDALHVEAAKRGDGLAVQLSSNAMNGNALNGEVVWLPHGYQSGGMLRARLNNLQWLGEESQGQTETLAWTTEQAKNGAAGNFAAASQHGTLHPADLPALEVAVENMQVEGKQIGRFELVGHPEGKDWRLRRLNITNPDGSLTGDGVWNNSGIRQQTQVKLLLDISDAGKILGRSGYPNTVKGGSGRLEANLAWSGAPDEFSLATLDGSLNLDTGKGRFIKMDPGAGKLLSILSLQSLPKRITLDFTDVFSEGFQFDKISGNATIKNGVLDTQDFHIDGSAAKVTMKGSVNLNNETQNLNVRILPTLGDSVSLIGAFAISPAVGIGSLIVNKVLGDPLDKLASFEYNVSGTWNNPNVVKVGGPKVQNNNLNLSE